LLGSESEQPGNGNLWITFYRECLRLLQVRDIGVPAVCGAEEVGALAGGLEVFWAEPVCGTGAGGRLCAVCGLMTLAQN